MKFYSAICRLVVATLFVLTCSNAKAQTISNKIIGVTYKEGSVLNEQVAQVLNLIIIRQPTQPSKGTYMQSFNMPDSSRTNLHISYGIDLETGLLGEVVISGSKEMLAKIYKALFDNKFAPKDPDYVRTYTTRGKEVISIYTGYADGNIRISAKKR